MPAGRSSTYSQTIADAICERLLEGESLVDICEHSAMPSRATVYRWMDENAEFETRCARAREGQADYMDALILRTANGTTADSAQADRVKISAYQWRASKLSPKRYGDKQEITHSGSVDVRGWMLEAAKAVEERD